MSVFSSCNCLLANLSSSFLVFRQFFITIYRRSNASKDFFSFLLQLPISGVFSSSLFTFCGSSGSCCTCKVRVIFRLHIVFIRLFAILPSIVVVTCLWWIIHLYAIVLTDIIANRQPSPLHVQFYCYVKTRIVILRFSWQQHHRSTNVLPAPEFSQCLQNMTDLVPDLVLLVNMLPGTQILHYWCWWHSLCLFFSRLYIFLAKNVNVLLYC